MVAVRSGRIDLHDRPIDASTSSDSQPAKQCKRVEPSGIAETLNDGF